MDYSKSVVTTSRFSDDFEKSLSSNGINLKYMSGRKINTSDLLNVQALVTYDIFDRIDLEELSELKFIQLTSQGFDHVPLNILIKNGIRLSNNYGGYSIPISEWIISRVLSTYKNMFQSYENQIKKKWERDLTYTEIKGKKVLFFGTGTISSTTAKLFNAFGAVCDGINYSGRSVEYFNRTFSYSKMEDISDYDIYIIALPVTEITESIMSVKLINSLKENSILINVSRGTILKENTVLETYARFKAIYLDVFEVEPLPETSKLWDISNIFISAHNSWFSDGNQMRLEERVYKNLTSFFENGKIHNEIDLKRGY